MDDLYTLHGDKVHVLNIYTREAHPFDDRPMIYSSDEDGNPIHQPTTYEERVAMAAKTIEEVELSLPVLVDSIDNPVYCSYGRRPNNAYFIGMDGKVVFIQEWSHPAEMEGVILEYLESQP